MRIGGGAVSIADVTNRPARDLGFVRPFWLNEIRAGRAFVGGSSVGPSPGAFSHIQLINPAGSGITIIVYDVLVGGESAGRAALNTHNVDLASDLGTQSNLLAGAAASVGHVRTTNNGARQGTLVARYRIAADSAQQIAPEWSWELGAGEGILVHNDTVNENVVVTYRWIEV